MKFPDYSNMRSTTLLITRMKSGANKNRKNLVDELKGHEEARNKTARLREKYEEIQAAIEQNYSHKLIAAALEKQGLKFPSQRSFETTWHRIKKEKSGQISNATSALDVTHVNKRKERTAVATPNQTARQPGEEIDFAALAAGLQTEKTDNGFMKMPGEPDVPTGKAGS